MTRSLADATLRSGTPEDAEALAALAIQVWLHTYATSGVSDTIARHVLATYGPAAMARLCVDEDASVIVATRADALIGFAVVRFGAAWRTDEEPRSELATLYVQEHFARRGVGTALLREAEDAATRRDGRAPWLTVNAQNAAAIAFYLAAGYRRVDTAFFALGDGLHENHVLVGAGADVTARSPALSPIR